MKWNRRGAGGWVGDIGGVVVRGVGGPSERGRDTGRHEQASKCQGETNSWRRNLLWEVCVCLARKVCARVHVHLYTAAYLFCLVYNKHAQGPQ